MQRRNQVPVRMNLEHWSDYQDDEGTGFNIDKLCFKIDWLTMTTQADHDKLMSIMIT